MNPLQAIDFSDTSEYLKVSRDDLNLYFAETFLFFEDDNRWEYVKFFDVGNNDNTVMFTRGVGNHENTSRLGERRISFKFPDTGLYNYKAGVVFLYRKTGRQNKKGVCSQTIGIYNTLGLFNRFASFPPQFLMAQSWKMTVPSLNQLLMKEDVVELAHAFSNVSRLKHFARTLGRDFFVGQGIDSKYPSLWFRQTAIGSVVTKNQVVIKNPLFEQEALDFFLPQGVVVNSETDGL